MEDLAVSGLLVRSASRSGEVSLQLSLHGEGIKGQLAIHWQEPGAAPMAAISGRINGKTVRASSEAP
jgi:hypothetical protein